MRYIQKGDEPIELVNWRNKHQINLQNKYKDTNVSGTNLWKFIDNEGKDDTCNKSFLKEILVTEQGHICCYCGQRIESNHKTAIEHLKAKKDNKHLVYDYFNLLASCSGGTAYIFYKIENEEDTLISIAKQFDVNVEDLEEIWVNNHYLAAFGRDLDIENLQIGDRVIIIPKVNKEQQHCDPEKKYKTITITPLQSNCQTKFSFKQDSGEIIETDENKDTIKNLGLNNNHFLNRRRLKRIDAAILLRKLITERFGTNKATFLSKINEAINNLENPKDGLFQPFIFVTTNVLKGI